MLSAQDNDTLCRVGPGTPTGEALRRYWLPVLPTGDLPGPDGDPKAVQLLGERFVAWRDAQGRPGLFADACLHRGASMLLSRAEGDGLRCIYHGWKFAVDGAVLDTPNVADPAFRQRIRGRTYPVREAGGLLWAYLGPKQHEPAFPAWPWMDLPDAHRVVTVHVEECNFVQVIEGLVDSSHLGILHSDGMQRSGGSDVAFAKKISSMQFDLAPRLEAQDTDFGFHYAALRDIVTPEGRRTEARVAAFVAPCVVLNPNGDIFTAVVPWGDELTAFIHVFWDASRPLGEEPLRSQHLAFVGLDAATLAGFGLRPDSPMADRPRRENGFHQDRAAMRRGERFSGFPGIIADDVAVSVASGGIRDRQQEVLSTADVAVARLYRTLLRSARQVQQGGAPVGLDVPVDLSKVVGANGPLMGGQAWSSLVPGHVVTTGAKAA